MTFHVGIISSGRNAHLKVFPIMAIYRLPCGQYGYSGHILNVPQHLLTIYPGVQLLLILSLLGNRILESEDQMYLWPWQWLIITTVVSLSIMIH